MFNVPCGCVKPCLEQEKIKTWCVFMFSCTEILSFLTDKTLHSWVMRFSWSWPTKKCTHFDLPFQ